VAADSSEVQESVPPPQPIKAILLASTMNIPTVMASSQTRSVDFWPASHRPAAMTVNTGSMMLAAPRWVITSQGYAA